MTRPNVKLTKKQLVLLVIIAVGLLVFGILTAVSGAVGRNTENAVLCKVLGSGWQIFDGECVPA